MKKLISLSLYICLAFLIGCADSDSCRYDFAAPVNDVEGPNQGNVNVEFELKVFYTPDNGCATFKNFELRELADKIWVVNPIIRGNCNCTIPTDIFEEDFKFTPTEPGTYTFRFIKVNNEAIVRNVVVE